MTTRPFGAAGRRCGQESVASSNQLEVTIYFRRMERVTGFQKFRAYRRIAAPFVALAVFGNIYAATPTPVILISIDTLRADHLSAYGYRAVQTQNIDAFADQGTLFAHADSQIPLTLPSHASLFTSTYPFQNRVEENAERVPPGAVTLASVLQSHGYKTAAFVASVFLEKEMGLDQGFDFYDSPFRFEAFSPLSGSMFFGGASRNRYAARDRREGALAVRAALEWLAENRDQQIGRAHV